MSLKKDPKYLDKLKTHCSKCRYGVFEGQKWVWTSNGIVHKECVT